MWTTGLNCRFVRDRPVIFSLVSARQERRRTSPQLDSSSSYWTRLLSCGTSRCSTSKQLRYHQLVFFFLSTIRIVSKLQESTLPEHLQAGGAVISNVSRCRDLKPLWLQWSISRISAFCQTLVNGLCKPYQSRICGKEFPLPEWNEY